MPDFLKVENDGPKIVSSNYWGSDYDKAGYAYLSPNAGVWRLLLPSGFADTADMKTAEGIAITAGFSKQFGRNMVELLFDDGAEDPYALFLSPEQAERLPSEDRTERRFTVWLPGANCVMDKPSYFRRRGIPCLRPWRQP